MSQTTQVEVARSVMLTPKQRRKIRAAIEIAYGDEDDEIARALTDEEYDELLGLFVDP